ncbi:MAG: hypothetical protein JSW61_09605 [Candidatus Thorarchaeota archaeon]|nr:MAG: hypothetical protein JSW61_09605 [Candidatus Thorarchaeota archaeon]
MAKKKKSSKKKAISPSLFKVTGPDAKLKVTAKKKLYYFGPKVKPEKAKKLAAGTGSEIFGVSGSALKVGTPTLKYEFYINCDCTAEKKFLSVRGQEIGVQDEMVAALVGKTVITPKKAKEPPMKRIDLDIIELYEAKRTDTMVYDGRTGSPARVMEKIVKGAGKKAASASWIRKAKIAPGKFNSLEKFLKVYTKNASVRPKSVKRTTEQTLNFKKLEGHYVPTYYVKVAAGADSRTLRVNAISGTVALA